jgi:hypothetical protein
MALSSGEKNRITRLLALSGLGLGAALAIGAGPALAATAATSRPRTACRSRRAGIGRRLLRRRPAMWQLIDELEFPSLLRSFSKMID